MEAQARVDHKWIQKRGRKEDNQPRVEKPTIHARQQSKQTSYSVETLSPNMEISSDRDSTSVDHGVDRGTNERTHDSQLQSDIPDSSLSSLNSNANASNDASTPLLSVVHSTLSHTDSNDLTYPSPIQVSSQLHSPFGPVAWTPTTANPLTPVTTPGELSLQHNTSSSTQLSEILYKKQHRRIEDEDRLRERGVSRAAAKVSKSPGVSDSSFQGAFAGLKKMLQRIRATSISPSPQKRHSGNAMEAADTTRTTANIIPIKSSSAQHTLSDNQSSSVPVHNNASISPRGKPASIKTPGGDTSSITSPGSKMSPKTSPGGNESLRSSSPFQSALKSLRKLHSQKTPLATSSASPGDSQCQPSDRVRTLSRLQSELRSYLSPSPKHSRRRLKLNNSPDSKRKSKTNGDRGSKYKTSFGRQRLRDATQTRFVFCFASFPCIPWVPEHRSVCV